MSISGGTHEKNGLLKDVEDFYENKHINSYLLSVNFTDMTDDEFHQALFESNKILITNYYNNQIKKSTDTACELYLNKNASFRGFRQT